MKLNNILSVATLLLAGFAAGNAIPQNTESKSYIIFFEADNVDQGLVNTVHNLLLSAGATITHTYTIFKGFAVNISGPALAKFEHLIEETYTTQNIAENWKPKIEPDQVVTISNENGPQ